MRDSFNKLEQDLNNVLVERNEEIHTAILAILSRRHHFQLGPPGIAKSMLVEEIVKRISGLGDDGYFKWLLTRFTVPEELFGGPDFNLLKNEGIYKRVTAGKLPRAFFAFPDEIFKANSAILNSLLKIMNENEFDNNDDDPSVPLMTMFAASNEPPQSNELEAMADRLHFWHYVKPINDSGNFVRMLSSAKSIDPEPIIDLEDIYRAQDEVRNVVIPDEVYEVLVELRDKLNTNDVPVTDRRFFQALDVIRAEAWMNGNEVALISDTKPLMHMMWRDVSQIDFVRRSVLDLADPLERDALELLDELEKTFAHFQTTLIESDNKTLKANHAIEVFGKIKEAKKEWRSMRAREKEAGRRCEAIHVLKDRIVEMSSILLKEGLGISESPDKFDEEEVVETVNPEDEI